MLANNLQSETTGPWTFNPEVLHENTFPVIDQMQINVHIININDYFEDISFEQILKEISFKNLNNSEDSDEKIESFIQLDINSNYLIKKRKRQKIIFKTKKIINKYDQKIKQYNGHN